MPVGSTNTNAIATATKYTSNTKFPRFSSVNSTYEKDNTMALIDQNGIQ